MDTNSENNKNANRSEPPCFCKFLKIKPISCVSMSNFRLTLSNLLPNMKKLRKSNKKWTYDICWTLKKSRILKYLYNQKNIKGKNSQVKKCVLKYLWVSWIFKLFDGIALKICKLSLVLLQINYFGEPTPIYRNSLWKFIEIFKRDEK